MVRITKTMQAKHLETLSPWLKEYCNTACSISLPLLPQHLASFPTRWPFPRGDLYHWISLLNRFDVIYDNFCKTYKLDEGPQTTDFACQLLESRTGEPEDTANGHDLTELGFGEDGDRQLVESILRFSEMLYKSCGNRSLYASSSHLNNLVNTTSLSLLEAVLSLGTELAKRYHAAFKRMHSHPKHQAGLLLNHYNIELDKVNQLAMPFAKKVSAEAETAQPATPATPGAKGREKAIFSTPTNQKSSTTTVYANDLVSLVKGGSGVGNSPKSGRNGVDTAPPRSDTDWEEWGDVKVTYYPKSTEAEPTPRAPAPATPTTPATPAPITPTPVRRSSNLGPHAHRSSRGSGSDESPTVARSTNIPSEEAQRPHFKIIEISSSQVKSKGIHALLEENVTGLPETFKYELLTKLRVANALTSSLEVRRQLLAIRLLAITNLAYIYQEPAFVETVLKQDGDEPRRLQLAYQLAELVHPPTDGDVAVPRHLQTVAFSALAALSQHQIKYSDVCAALNTNVNHGVLLYVVRKAVAEMGVEDLGDKTTEKDEWQDALLDLINDISVTPRTSGDLVTAGLIPILVEILGLRTKVAERFQPKVLGFLDNIMYSARDAFQTLVSADGLNAVSNLIVFEVTTASKNAASGKGMPVDHRSATVDYEIPYFQQQTLKWLFKFIHHMMTTAGGYGGNFDRLLRNLIDSTQLLGSLREIITNARRFGSIVWTNSVSILNDFINNEPTSFAVIAEAGLSRGLLEAVTGRLITMPDEPKKEEPAVESEDAPAETGSPESPGSHHSDSDSEAEHEQEHQLGQLPARPSLAELQTPRQGPLARGIMPTSETISIVPQAFGAICLNNAGMKMFQASGALESFFEVFESPEHVKCMDTNKDLPASLGSTFDELVRHHPQLKPAIMNAILNMVTRVSSLCKRKAENDKLGAKLWIADASGKMVIADNDIRSATALKSLKGKEKAFDNGGDVEMVDADAEVADVVATPSSDLKSRTSMTPYVAALATFLSAIFSNSQVRADFAGKGGIEYVLDLADSPCLSYDFSDGPASRHLQQVIALLAEQKPHLTIPSLLRRAQLAADVLAPFIAFPVTHPNESFFQPFIDGEKRMLSDPDLLGNGTNFAKALVNVHSLVSILHACFQSSAYNHRSTNAGFNQLNLSDYYVRLVKSLGGLLGASFREFIAQDKVVPASYKPSKFKDLSPLSLAPVTVGSEIPTPAVELPSLPVLEPLSPSPPNGNLSTSSATTVLPVREEKPKSLTKAEKDTPEYKNYVILQHLLRRMGRTISPFFQLLGKSLVSKRGNGDGYQKQSHAAIAAALAEALLAEFEPRIPADANHKLPNGNHWLHVLHPLKDILIDVSRHNERPVQTITLVLQAFKAKGGFDVLNKILKEFGQVIATPLPSSSDSPSDLANFESDYAIAVAGMRTILLLYSQIANGKNVTESVQTMAMASRDRADRTRPDFFLPSQFLVELRMAILPTVRGLWETDMHEKAPSEISEQLIDVIKTIAVADSEAGAFKRSENPVTIVKAHHKKFKLNDAHVATLTEICDSDLAKEALFRCNNIFSFADEYAREVQEQNRSRYPVPDGEVEETSASRPQTGTSTGSGTPDYGSRTPVIPAPPPAGNDPLADVPALIESISQQMPPPPAPGSEPATPQTAQDFGFLLDQFGASRSPSGALQSSASSVAKETPSKEVKEETPAKQVTVDDLNEERAAIRDNLIDKCLDVINAHGEVTFEIADLITTVVTKSPDVSAQRKTVGETLVVALMSFDSDEDLTKSGKKIASYAHLLALMLRDKSFYNAAAGELKENLSTLLGFIKLSPNHSSDEASPWIAQILLIVEMLLSEDERPRKLRWTPPHSDDEVIPSPVLEPFEPSIPAEEQDQLLTAILDILPHIKKDESLALSILRILVILTRNRPMAHKMGEKRNIQRLFLMAKQLAGASSARIQGPLMIILRHIIEDEETIKQIMRSDIKAHFESAKTQRVAGDPSSYLRALAHTAIRAPQIFVDVTNEMVKYSRWAYPSQEASSRSNALALKEVPAPESTSKPSEDGVQPTVQATEDLTLQDVKPSTEDVDTFMEDVSKAAPTEHKLPVVENPDGVIHFLLCELLNYREVEDKDPAPVGSDSASPAVASASTPSINGDESSAATPSTPTPSSAETVLMQKLKAQKPSSKLDFKPEDHPIYIYRCFLLQCLTELLGSYNRTKIEFINFKRSAPPQAMTPSKPRSSIVNYLLSDLIPYGTMDPSPTIALQKKITTSSWADSVLTALLAKTGEAPVDKNREPSDGNDEPDLVFVRRFVLDNIIKAYKDASTSNEPLDARYSRLYSLAELMDHIMQEKESTNESFISSRSHAQLRRLMFEKGFITALTTSIADVDLNFPGAKRAVKQILKPLKVLTTTAVQLSDLSLISSTPGQGEDDEIESATSVSDVDDREETPDLFRNSTLGMFEPGREEDSSSESEDDDEEMYEDGYGDEMEYEEEPEDPEEDISEDDDDPEGMGPIEGLSGDHPLAVDVVMEVDEDDDDEDDEDGESSDDDHDSEDDDDVQDRLEIVDEAGNIQHIGMDEAMGGDWEDEDEDEEDDGEEEDYEGQAQDEDEEQIHGMEAMMGAGGPLGELVRALGGNGASLQMADRIDEDMQDEDLDRAEIEDDMDDEEERMGADYLEEDEEDEDEGDDMDDEIFLDQYPGDGPGPVAFGWEGEVDPPMVIHRHGHRPRHTFASPFPLFPGGDPLGGPDFRYRSHAGRNAPPRTADDGTNPLLQRHGAGRIGSRDGPRPAGSWIQAVGPPGAAELLDLSRSPFGEGPAAAALFEMIRSLPDMPGNPRNGPASLQFHISAGPGQEIPRELQAMFGLRGPSRYESRREAAESGAAFFQPQTTSSRWIEEAKILFGAEYIAAATNLRSAIDSVLVPPAIEADKIKKAAEAERARKAEEEAKKRQEEERLAKEAKEAEEKIEREKKEAEEAETAARLAAEALAERGEEPMEEESKDEEETSPDAMEGVEGESSPTEQPAEETPAADRPRVTTVIRGNTMDITDLGIDPEFLAELPEDLREEVIMSTVAERRSQATATGGQPSEIDQEFLDALPDDIRDEIIQQERQERRRREREEQRRAQAAANGGPAAVPDMDAASILATLPPALRQQVLMEQDEDMLNLLPQELADQARAAQRDHPAHAGRIPAALGRRVPQVVGVDLTRPPHGNQRPPRRAIVQMLDKSGIATLLRLMYTFQHAQLRQSLNSVLENISLNRHNRTEVLSTLLHILQDGSADMPAVERSFAQLSIRAKQPKEKDPKTPQAPLKRTFTGMSTSTNLTHTLSEAASPILVVQQCLSALTSLTHHNPHVPAYFLTEHEGAPGLKRSLSRKGKGKDNKANKYAINSLLSLLDRDLIMESSTIMELLSTLLSHITAPLQAFQRKQKEAEDAAKKAAAEAEKKAAEEAAKRAQEGPSVPDTNEPATLPETTTTNEQTREDPATATEPPVQDTNAQIHPASDTPEAPGKASSSEPKPEAKEPEKKPRQFIPPVIPEQNLKLVINIFIARECSSRTFRETLSTVKNLSTIPGAKAIFGRELITKAQGLGELILVDLEDLLPQIQKATTGTEIQGVALAKFSPGGSDQNKLLRVLTALDHLFDPKRDKKDQPTEAESEGESSQLVEKQDLLSSLYENSTFGPMWEKLSACLSAIRQREHMLNVATILLPLIEALMVVCKNTTLKEAPVARLGKEMMLTSPPPESRMESLFFTFTEEHRKILNDLVRHTPKLMSGTFSLLVKNPKVLEFDNKRNYFSRSIHTKATNSRQSFPPLQLSVRRDQVFHDSFKSLYFQTGDQMKYGKLSIRFHGEEGVDAGGVTREWFQVLSRQMFDPGYALFIPVSSDRTTFHPNQLSSINEEHLMFFKFIGRIIGKALYEGRVLDCHFSRAVYKRILGKAVSVKDMESLDPEYYKSLIWMLENDITDIISETFSVDNDKFGVVETIDFIPDGRNIAVTQENKHEYVSKMVEWRLTGSVKEQLDEFLKGFHEIIPAELVAIFNEQELELLISGLPEIDVDDWKGNTEYHNYTASSPQIQWFWRAVRSYDKEERAKLLQFVTGTSKVPLNGFQELEGMNGFSRFNIHRDYGNKERLPSSHTCFNQLDLPEYESYEALRSHVLTAITAGSEYFGFA